MSFTRGPSQQGTLKMQTVYKLNEHLPGYTGFVPKLQNVIASTYANSSRLAMSCPPTPDIETVAYDFAAGKRRLRTAAPLSGTGFRGFLDENDSVPYEMSDTFQKDYTQGSMVNLNGYYDEQRRKLELMKRTNPRSVTQKRNPIRNVSQIPFGDTFYYSGKHMFETTTKETLGQSARPRTTAAVASMTTMAKRNNAIDLGYQYKVAHAMIGKIKLDQLHKLVGEYVQAKVITGNKDMIKMFNFFAAKTGTGGHVTIGHRQFLEVVQKLGVYITEREACALFGRYDTECTGALTYFEFISLYFDDNERIKGDA